MIRTLFAVEFIQPNRPEERFDDEFSFVMDCNRFASEYNQFIVVWDWLFRSELSPTHSIRFLNPVMNKMYRTYYNSSGFPSGESRKEDVWWHLETGKLIKGAFHLYQWPMVFLIRPITKPSNCTQPGPPPVLHRIRQDNYSPTKPPHLNLVPWPTRTGCTWAQAPTDLRGERPPGAAARGESPAPCEIYWCLAERLPQDCPITVLLHFPPPSLSLFIFFNFGFFWHDNFPILLFFPDMSLWIYAYMYIYMCLIYITIFSQGKVSLFCLIVLSF